LKRHRDLGPHLAAERGLEFSGSQIAVVAVGAMSGVAAAGQIGSARTLMTPATTVIAGVFLFAVPEASRIANRGKRRLLRFTAGISIIVALAVCVMTLVLALLPNGVGHHLAGGNWSAAKAVLLPVAIWHAAAGARFGPAVGLRTLQRGRLIAKLSVVTAVAIVLVVVGGTALGNAPGAAWGFAFVYTAAVVLWWSAYLGQLRSEQTEIGGRAASEVEVRSSA
jgi:O-antigen/teichoic acid export membrane protein